VSPVLKFCGTVRKIFRGGGGGGGMPSPIDEYFPGRLRPAGPRLRKGYAFPMPWPPRGLHHTLGWWCHRGGEDIYYLYEAADIRLLPRKNFDEAAGEARCHDPSGDEAAKGLRHFNATEIYLFPRLFSLFKKLQSKL
jgi:hypothetical protein